MMLQADANEIKRAAGLFLSTGDVIEVRIPKAADGGTMSGYFDDQDKLVAAVIKANGAGPGIYATLNPTNPALLARAENRLQRKAQQTTSDPDIARRRWLLFDVDSKRPAGISASDAEHNAAIDCARSIRESLLADGWPEPVVADSGNGAHLLYAVDLTNDSDSTGLIKAVLTGAAERFDRSDVQVDQTVFNPSRISKLYGTVARKGDSTRERPHRATKILHLPDNIVTVGVEMLCKLAKPTTAPAIDERATGRSGSFDIDSWISRHGIDVAGTPEPYEGGRRWVLRACPFNPEHKSPDAALFQFASGAVAFKCLHNSCAGKDWRVFRELFEPLSSRRPTVSTYSSSNGQQPTMVGGWPSPLREPAYYGIIGDIVRAIEPETEADPAAVMIQALVAFGNLVGRGPYFSVGADRHYPNLFATMVGDSSKARKGSSWSITKSMLSACDEGWHLNCIQSGLSSGEGLIWAVRDQIQEEEEFRDKKTGDVSYHTKVIDRGVTDKRLLVEGSEFASVLRVQERDGSTLSGVIRQAWDTGSLRIIVKNNPAKATGAHISIVGHVTRPELMKYLTSTESANGFANRFLWVSVKRSKLLPEGGAFDRINWTPMIRRLHQSVDAARRAGELSRDPAAVRMWRDAYPRLTADRGGMFGAVTNRAEAQTLRLSMIYALLDGSDVITPDHLAAALEVWRYCEDSARHIFGEAIGDSTADQILLALRSTPAGLTRQEISEGVFQRNKRADEITRALKVLQQLGFVMVQSTPTEGRPVERWTAKVQTAVIH